jgi:hypothetical protein
MSRLSTERSRANKLRALAIEPIEAISLIERQIKASITDSD